MMKELSEKASLSCIYTNHKIRKTTATGLQRSGSTLEQIAHVTKHKNLDSLKHYVDKPTLCDKENYNDGLFNYAIRETLNQQEQHQNTRKKQKVLDNTPESDEEIENSNNNNNQIALKHPQDNPNQCVGNVDKNTIQQSQNVITNKLHQAPNLFQNATFTNCNFTFSIP